MQLARPDLLWLLWLLPILAGMEIFARRRALHRLQSFAPLDSARRLGLDAHRGRHAAKLLLVLMALVALVLAAVGVRLGFRWEEIHRRGQDIVVALDVSSSMQAQDGGTEDQISRLTRAKREISDLLRTLGGDRVALVAFAGDAFIQCPLTTDYGALETFLSDLDPDSISLQGTDLATAVEVSLKAFNAKSAAGRAIIILSDGENLSGNLEPAIDAAKKQNVRVYTLGIGKADGAPIPRPDGGFKRDRNNEVIMSRLDEATLSKLSLATGGLYVHAVPGDEDWQEIVWHGIKAGATEADLGSSRRRLWNERYQWFVAVALAALALEALLAERRHRKKQDA